jgi:Zn-finger nucleic acid-binding protein
MKCTSCNESNLMPSFIDNLFRAHNCNHCGGNWILIEDFLSWKEKNPEYSFAENIEYGEELEESAKALLCPVTGALMSKFRMSSKTKHRVDYSLSVGGIWLDAGEWELLKEEGLAGSLNILVTQSWQKKIRTETTKNNFSDIYAEKFGAESYAKIKEVRQWLQAQPQKADLRAYMLADDPYSVDR